MRKNDVQFLKVGKYISKEYLGNHFARASKWTKAIAITTVAQIAVQVVGFIAGIAIIRILSTSEYALYTLANAMLGTMTILSDAGISTGVMSQAGRVWNDKERLGVIMATGFNLRKKFAFFSLLVAVPILYFLVIQHHGSILTAILLILALIPSFLAALNDSLLEIVLKLHKQVVPLQINQLNVALGRLALICSGIFFFPLAFIAVLGNGIPRIIGNVRLKKLVADFADNKQQPDEEVRHKILNLVKRKLPDSIYYCLSSQITIWLISLLGSTTALAEVGVLGRLSVIEVLVSTVFATLIVPAFAKLSVPKEKLRRTYIGILAGIFVLGTMVIFMGWLFSKQILWLFGKNYYSLDGAIVLATVSICFNVVAAASFYLYSSRGLLMNPVYAILISFSTLVLGLLIIDVSTLHGILLFNILASFVNAAKHVIYGFFKIKKVPAADIA